MDYQGNSKKAKNEPENDGPKKEKKKIESVVVDEVIVQKVPLSRRFRGVFFGGEFSSAIQYILADVMLPAARNLMVDATTKGIERMVYGDSQYERTRRPEMRSRVQYNSPVARPRREGGSRAYLPDQPPHIARQSRRDVGEIILKSRSEAETVVERLSDIIDMYDVASMADLYDLLNLPTSHTDNKWGWSYMTGVNIRQIREGYLIELPPMEAL